VILIVQTEKQSGDADRVVAERNANGNWTLTTNTDLSVMGLLLQREMLAGIGEGSFQVVRQPGGNGGGP